MTVERGLRMETGLITGASGVLAAWHSPYWLLLTGFVALNQIQSAFTDGRPPVEVLGWAGLKRCREAP